MYKARLHVTLALLPLFSSPACSEGSITERAGFAGPDALQSDASRQDVPTDGSPNSLAIDAPQIADLPGSNNQLRDPGDPGLTLGTKFFGAMQVGERTFQFLGTAVAVTNSGVAHFFGIPDRNTIRGLSGFYLSFVFPASTWSPGGVALGQSPLGGEWRFVDEKTGKAYKLDLRKPEGAFTLQITEGSASTSMTVPAHFYLRGTLRASIPSEDGNGPPAVVDFKIGSSVPAS